MEHPAGRDGGGYAFNDTIPGPRIRLTEGDRVRIKVTNRLPESTTVHWHGLILPNEMDGPAKITQKPIPPGGSYTYEFTTEQAGTFFSITRTIMWTASRPLASTAH